MEYENEAGVPEAPVPRRDGTEEVEESCGDEIIVGIDCLKHAW
jgi:hypothetical protein